VKALEESFGLFPRRYAKKLLQQLTN